MNRTATSMILAATLLVACAGVSGAGAVNVDGNGLALQGYDPVAFHTESEALPGEAAITAEHEGATYRFATAANRDLFLEDPARYAPAYGGYCAYGVAKGGLYPVEIDTWQIVEGRLMLNYDDEVSHKFDRKRAAFVEKADSSWPRLVAEAGAKE
jgi:YHS domain-containing protein